MASWGHHQDDADPIRLPELSFITNTKAAGCLHPRDIPATLNHTYDRTEQMKVSPSLEQTKVMQTYN